MPYVMTIADIDLPNRTDDGKWVSIDILEAPAKEGPWTLIHNEVAPIYVDSDDAPSVDITVGAASLLMGWYVVRLTDDLGNTQDTEPFFLSAGRVAYVPSRSDVGALLRARTVDRFGNEVGTFNKDTRPNGQQVDRIVGYAVTDITDDIGLDPPSDVHNMVRSTAAIRAAMLVELTHFPEQVARGNSPYEQYERMYADKMKSLVKAVAQANNGDPIGPGGELTSSFAFPADAGGMVGWGTRW